MNMKEKFVQHLGNLKSKIVSFPKKKKIMYSGGAVVGVIALIVTLTLVISPNAWKIEVNGETVGYVPNEGRFTAMVEAVKDEISEELDNAEIEIVEDDVACDKTEDVKIKEVEPITEEELKDVLVEGQACKAQGYGINIDGECVVSTTGKDDLKEILKEIEAQLTEIEEGSTTQSIELEFPQEVTAEEELADVEEVMTTQEAISFLLTGYKEVPTYTVEAGLTIEQIAAKNGMSVEQLKKVNPQIKDNSVEEGQELEIYIPDPVLDVVTTEIIKSNLPVYPGIKYKDTDSLPAGTQKIEKEGKKGKKIVTKEVIKKNGVEKKETILDEDIVKEAKKQVVLRGTGDAYIGGDGKLGHPMKTLTMTSPYGARWGSIHRGIDYSNPRGTAIYASEAGTVVTAAASGSYGNAVKISHGGGLETLYAHCDTLLVKAGQKVAKGEKIATVGSTGRSTGNHLHFEVRVNGQHINPAKYL